MIVPFRDLVESPLVLLGARSLLEILLVAHLEDVSEASRHTPVGLVKCCYLTECVHPY